MILFMVPAVNLCAETPIPADLVGKYHGDWQTTEGGVGSFFQRPFTLELRADGTGTYCWESIRGSDKGGCSPVKATTFPRGVKIKYETNKAATITLDSKKKMFYWDGPGTARPQVTLESPIKRMAGE
jgi:hypothetical protein